MILMADLTDVLSDDGTAFQAYVRTRPIAPSGGISQLGFVREAHVVASPAPSTTVRLTLRTDFGARTAASDVDLTPEGSEKRVIPMFENLQDADITVAQVQIGDASAASSWWSLDMLILPTFEEGER